MAKRSSNNPKCQRYLAERRRIKNKTKKMENRLKTLKKETSIEHIKRDSRIGRTKEGFQKEDFKFRERKKNGI